MEESELDDEYSEQYKLQYELIMAIDNHNCSRVYDIIHRNGLSPDYKIEGKNPVCTAAQRGHTDILEILVEGGCNLNEPESDSDIWHRRAIHHAASKGHKTFVKRLLCLGVDIDSRDDDNRTPLHWAATYGDAEMTEYLINEGATVNIAQCDGFTPLHAATCLGHVLVCEILLRHGAQINMSDRDGWNALHTAVCYGHMEVVKTLLDSGASLSHLTSDEENVVHIAASSGKVEIVKLLVERGVDVNALNLNGNTAFYLAVYYNELEMAKYLLKIGANMYTTTCNVSPFYVAALRCKLEFIALFILNGYNFSSETWILSKDFPIALEQMPDVCDLLHQLASNPWSLKQASAIQVRKCIQYDNEEGFSRKLAQTGLPASLQQFVSYRCVDEMQTLYVVTND